MKLTKTTILLVTILCLSSLFVIADDTTATIDNNITEPCNHEFNDPIYYQFGNQHYQLCSICKEKIYDDHDFKTIGINDIYHATSCATCGLRVVQLHTNFKSIDDSTHTAKCSACDYKSSIEMHTYSNNVCTICEYDGMIFNYFKKHRF